MRMVEAQDQYIARVNGCQPGHRNRVSRSAWKQLYLWAESKGFPPNDCRVVCQEARDMAELERNAED
jgi:hypothetical protein